MAATIAVVVIFVVVVVVVITIIGVVVFVVVSRSQFVCLDECKCVCVYHLRVKYRGDFLLITMSTIFTTKRSVSGETKLKKNYAH